MREVKASMSTFYFKMVDGSLYTLNHKGGDNISFTQAQKVVDEELDYDKIHLKAVHNIVNIYSGIVLMNLNGVAYAFISHGRFVSKYDLISLKWVNHVEFEDDIIKMFRCETLKARSEVCLLLANGAFYAKVGAFDQ